MHICTGTTTWKQAHRYTSAPHRTILTSTTSANTSTIITGVWFTPTNNATSRSYIAVLANIAGVSAPNPSCATTPQHALSFVGGGWYCVWKPCQHSMAPFRGTCMSLLCMAVIVRTRNKASAA